MKTKVQIIFYSMYGHVYRLAEAVAQGAKEVTDVETGIFQVPELVPDDILEQSGAKKARGIRAYSGGAEWSNFPMRTRSSSARPHASATCAPRCAIFSINAVGIGCAAL